MFAQIVEQTARLGSMPPVYKESQALEQIGAQAVRFGSQGVEPPKNTAEFQALYGSIAVINRCASLVSMSVSQGRLRFYRGEEGNKQYLEPPHPLLDLFEEINPHDTKRRWLAGMSLYRRLTGNAYSELCRARPESAVEQLVVLQSARMLVVPGLQGPSGYIHEVDGKHEPFAPEQIWHTKTLNPNDDWYGLSAFAAGSRALLSTQQTEEQTNKLLKNGVAPSGMMTMDSDDEETIKLATEMFHEAHAGSANAGKVVFVGMGRKFERFQLTPAELQSLELLQYNKHEVMQLCGVYPIVYGIVDQSATRENATTQERLYYTLTVLPEAMDIADDMTERLIPALGILGTEGVKAELSYGHLPIFKLLAIEEALAQAQLVRDGIRTQNEIRAELGEEPVPWGDTWHRPLGLSPVDEQRQAELERALVRAQSAVAELFDRPLLLQAQTKNINDVIAAGEVEPDNELWLQLRLVFGETLKLSAEAALVELGLDIDFDSETEAVQQWLTDLQNQVANKTWETTSGKVLETLKEGEDAGENLADLARRVEDVMGDRIKSSATTWARTETIAPATRGGQEAYRQAGLEQNEWLTAKDGEVRDSHRALDGKRVIIGEEFAPNLKYPGDPDAAPGDRINCRCLLLGVVPGARSVEQREALWKQHDALLTEQEAKAAKVFRSILEEQQRRLLRALRAEVNSTAGV